MADRDRSAVDVQLVRIDAEFVAAIDHLDSVGFVEFPEVNVVYIQIVPLQQSRDCDDRADAHFVRLNAGGDEAAEDAERLQTLPWRDRGAHDDAGRGTAGELAGIAGADGLALEYRLDLFRPLGVVSGRGPSSLVSVPCR